MDTPAFFICDSDTAFLTALHERESPSLRIVSARNRVDAQLRLADHSQRYSAIAINANVCEPYSLPLIRFCKMHRPATPICLMGDTPESLPGPEELKAVHVQQTAVKPVAPAELISQIFPSALFDKNKLLALASTEAKPGEEALHEDNGMHAISAESFLCGKKSFFDVYVQLRPGKYVMILKAGDDFDFERVATYLRKGVKSFFIKKEAQQYFLQYCDKLTEALLKSEKIGAKAKQDQVQNYGRETLELLKNCGVSEMNLASARRFGGFAHTLVRQVEKQNDAIQNFLSSAAHCDHGTGTAMILALMLDAMEYRDEKVVSVVAMGGLLHDIGLLWLPEKWTEADADQFSETDRARYEEHPAQGAEILTKIPNINPLLPQVVLQHHERRDRKGFPAKLGPGFISPVSEMIGLADTFQNLMVKAKKENFDPLRELRSQHYDKFSLNIVEGFKKAMNLKA